MLQKAKGAFMSTSTAKMELKSWYDTRQNPDEELLFSSWNRNPELLFKFAMILCLADGGPMIIQHKHVIYAQDMVNMVYGFNERLIEAASESYTTKPINTLERYIQRQRTVGHTKSMRYFRSTKGMNAKQFREAVGELVQDGCVEMGQGAKGGGVYIWKGA